MEHMQCSKGERLFGNGNVVTDYPATNCGNCTNLHTLERLQSQFDQTMDINHDLTNKLELVQCQQREQEVKFQMLTANIHTLRKALRDVEQEKSDLYSQTQAILHREKSLENEDTFHISIVQLLKQQLSESEDKHEDTKEMLVASRQRSDELGTRVFELDKELSLAKIEVWNLTRYTTELEFQLVTTRKDVAMAKEELEAKKARELEMDSRISLLNEKFIGFKGSIKHGITGGRDGRSRFMPIGFSPA